MDSPAFGLSIATFGALMFVSGLFVGAGLACYRLYHSGRRDGARAARRLCRREARTIIEYVGPQPARLGYHGEED